MIALTLIYTTGCRECGTMQDDGNPERYIRLIGSGGDNLWFGDSVTYDPAEVVFDHEVFGELDSEPVPSEGAVSLVFPETDGEVQRIEMRIDSNTTYTLSYNTLVYSRECEMIYELSFVQLQGEQLCTVCGNTRFNDDEYINIPVD